MPSYGDTNIFGPSATIETEDRERAVQRNEFFGLNGFASLDGGSRGFATSAKGVLIADNLFDLGALKNICWSFNDGVARNLVDSLGYTWIAVKLTSFKPIGRSVFDPGKGAVVAYQMTFEHLI